MLSIDEKVGKIQNVPGAVWFAGLLLTYNEVVINKRNNIYFSQSEIQKVAQKLCSKLVHSPRVNQWCNGDHPKNNYNYLRALGKKRRLTRMGEFNGTTEYPEHLYNLDSVILSVGEHNEDVTYGDLFYWYKTVYVSMEL